MTTVLVSTTSSSSYTWASMAGKAWGSGEAGKSWSEAATRTIEAAVNESLLAEELGARNFTRSVYLSFGSSDSAARTIGKNHLGSVGVASSYIDNIAFVIRAMESLSVVEGLKKQVGLSAFDLTGVTSSGFRKSIELKTSQALGFAEVFGRTVTYRRAYDETINGSSAISKATTISRAAALNVFDEYMRRGNAVFSDMVLLNDSITFDGFKQILEGGIVPGYAPFRDFIPGDYDYQYALFRAVLESSNSDRARLSQLRVDVDVPDVIETGSATIVVAATGIRVNFSRLFHIVPEITMNLRGGTVIAIPDLVSSDVLGFTAVLRNMSDVRVTGTLTWAAHGY